MGGIFIVISDALRAGADGDPPYNMSRALVFQAVMALAVVPLPMVLGWLVDVRQGRMEAEKMSRERERALESEARPESNEGQTFRP